MSNVKSCIDWNLARRFQTESSMRKHRAAFFKSSLQSPRCLRKPEKWRLLLRTRFRSSTLLHKQGIGRKICKESFMLFRQSLLLITALSEVILFYFINKKELFCWNANMSISCYFLLSKCSDMILPIWFFLEWCKLAVFHWWGILTSKMWLTF